VVVSPRRTVVFASSSTSQEIIVLNLDRSTGALHERRRQAVPGDGGPMPGSLGLALSPDRRFLYASLRQEPYLTVSFAVDPADGNLKVLGRSSMPERPAEILCDTTGHFLFGVSYS
jgi:6-phosphogluconolactonase